MTEVVPILAIPRELFEQTWLGLRERARGCVESFAIWAGVTNSPTPLVKSVYFTDNLPGVRQGRLFHKVPRQSMNALLDVLHKERLFLIADVHCHPGR